MVLLIAVFMSADRQICGFKKNADGAIEESNEASLLCTAFLAFEELCITTEQVPAKPFL